MSDITQSLKLDRRMKNVVLYDVAAYGTVLIFVALFFSFFEETLSGVPAPPVLDPLVTSAEELQAIYQATRNAIHSAIAGAVLAVVLSFASWNYFKGRTYGALLDHPFTSKRAARYVYVKLVWLLMWLIPVLILTLLLRGELLLPFLVLIAVFYFQLTFMLNIEFFNKPKLDVVRTVIRKYKKAWFAVSMPGIIILVVGALVSQLYWVYLKLSNPVFFALVVATLALYGSWARKYLYIVYKKAQ